MTKRIDLPGDEWAELRTAWDVTRGQRKELFKAITADGAEDGDAAVIALMVATWSRSEPVSQEAIDNLPVPVANVLTTAAVDFMKEMSPDFTPDGAVDPKAEEASSEKSES